MVSDTLSVAGGSAGTSGDERLLIEFELAGESYGVEISTVREIIRLQEITRVPGVPDVVEGIINLRGVVVPIVDLRKRRGVTVTEQGDDSRVIVTEIDQALVGVLVDAVTGVIRMSAGDLQPLSKHAQTEDSDYLEGVAQFDERLVVLVNIVRALERESLHNVKWDGEVVATAIEAASAEVTADEPKEGLPLKIELLETSFEALKPRGDELVEYFYDQLFEQYPSVLPLFEGADMQKQQGKLLSALATVVTSLRTPEVLVPHLQELGRKHVAYGAEPAHYDAVGQVLLESMAAIAGDLWNDELLAAWAEAYGIVSSVMIEAASEVEAPVQLHPELDEPSEEEAPEGGLPLQIELLETSFEALKPRGDELVEYFYDQLFEQYPTVLPLFEGADMQKQQGKLLSALALVVASLRTPEALVPHLQELGRKHVAYGAEAAHYDAVGAVLLESMAAMAGDLWNDELQGAWAEAYGLVASVMIEAASETAVDEEPVAEPIEFAEARKAVEQKQAATKPTAKKPSAKKPAAKKSAATKPAAQSTAAAKKSTASKKPAAKTKVS